MTEDLYDGADGPGPEQEVATVSAVMAAVQECVARYRWQGPFFDIHPFDPIAYIVFSCFARSPDEQEGNLRDVAALAALARFVTLEARCKLLDEIDRHLAVEADLEVRPLLRLTANLINRPTLPVAATVSLISLVLEEITDALQERSKIEEGERGKDNPLIAGLLRELEGASGPEADALAERLAAFGQEALPQLCATLFPAEKEVALEPTGRAVALAKVLGRARGMRSINALITVLINDAKEELLSACAESLVAQGETAAKLLTDALRMGIFGGRVRLRLYEALARCEGARLLPRLCLEFDEKLWPEGEFTDAVFSSLVDLTLRTNDRQAVPFFIRMLRRKSLPPSRRDALRARLQRSPWWEEINLALQRLKEGKVVFVPESRERRRPDTRPPKRATGRKKEKSRRGAPAASPDEERRLYSEAYHERLGWRRPIDLPPRDERLRQVDELGDRDYRAYCLAHGVGPQSGELAEEFEDFWTFEPHVDLGGESPWVVQTRGVADSLPEKERQPYLDEAADDLYETACELLDDEKDRAEKALRAVLGVMPGHALARRMLQRLEAGPEPQAPRIIIPGR